MSVRTVGGPLRDLRAPLDRGRVVSQDVKPEHTKTDLNDTCARACTINDTLWEPPARTNFKSGGEARTKTLEALNATFLLHLP